MGDPPLPRPQVPICLNFFEKIIVPPCCICLIFFVLSNIDIYYFMQESIEPVVLEEHQSEVVGDPPLPPRQVNVCFTFFENIIFCPYSVYMSRFFLLSEIDICYFMQASSEAPVLEDHQIGYPHLTSQQEHFLCTHVI